MAKDQARRAYRKSPGRQYGYDYDPLHSDYQVGQSKSTSTPSRGGERSILRPAQRPDPRRTRQLLRQNILAGKLKGQVEETEEARENTSSAYSYGIDTPRQRSEASQPRVTRRFGTTEDDLYPDEYAGREDEPMYRSRNRELSEEYPRGPVQRYPETDEELENNWREYDFVDPDIGYEDPLDQRVGYAESPLARRSPGTSRRSLRPAQEAYPDYDEEEEQEERERVPRGKRKKRGMTRRKLLVALGIGAVAAGGVAAYELAPRIPGALQQAGTNIEHELQDAFNKGVAQGAQEVRREFVNALDSVEGVSLQAAIDSARLTRLAYDAFVSPIVTLAATITGDFLNIVLRAIITGRGWLARINQDNDTLAALQTVLQTWVQKVNELPMQLQSITDSDLDGAQSYLRGLQRTLQQQQAILNGQATPTPTTRPDPTAATKKS